MKFNYTNNKSTTATQETNKQKALRYLLATVVILAVVVLATGCAGRAGADGAKGDVGATGAAGERGAAGAKGDAGADATSIAMVKLCPNIVGSYNNFPEFALRINNVLYATYSSGGNAFTTQLYPGTYSTTTNAGNCTFVVDANGQLQQ